MSTRGKSSPSAGRTRKRSPDDLHVASERGSVESHEAGTTIADAYTCAVQLPSHVLAYIAFVPIARYLPATGERSEDYKPGDNPGRRPSVPRFESSRPAFPRRRSPPRRRGTHDSRSPTPRPTRGFHHTLSFSIHYTSPMSTNYIDPTALDDWSRPLDRAGFDSRRRRVLV